MLFVSNQNFRIHGLVFEQNVISVDEEENLTAVYFMRLYIYVSVDTRLVLIFFRRLLRSVYRACVVWTVFFWCQKQSDMPSYHIRNIVTSFKKKTNKHLTAVLPNEILHIISVE